MGGTRKTGLTGLLGMKNGAKIAFDLRKKVRKNSRSDKRKGKTRVGETRPPSEAHISYVFKDMAMVDHSSES